MRIRKTNAILGTALIIGVLMMIYLVIDTISYEDLDAQKEELNGLEIKLRSLENDLLVNQKTIDLIKGQKISKAISDLLNSSKNPTKKNSPMALSSNMHKTSGICSIIFVILTCLSYFHFEKKNSAVYLLKQSG